MLNLAFPFFYMLTVVSLNIFLFSNAQYAKLTMFFRDGHFISHYNVLSEISQQL